MAAHGSFVGTPKTEWLTAPSGADRDMKLLEEFMYIDLDGLTWRAPRPPRSSAEQTHRQQQQCSTSKPSYRHEFLYYNTVI